MFKNKPRMSEPDINELASKIESLDHQLDNLYEQITYSRTEVQYLLEIYQNHVIFPQHCESLKNTDMKILCQLLLDCQKLCDSILTIGNFFNDINILELRHRIITALWKNITNKLDPESEEK